MPLYVMIQHVMPNTSSAKKALKQSKKKRQHNLFWKRRIRNMVKNIRRQLADGSVNADIIKKKESLLYKIIDKAAKNDVIKKNKASRLKSKVAKELSAYAPTKTKTTKKSGSAAKAVKSTKTKAVSKETKSTKATATKKSKSNSKSKS